MYMIDLLIYVQFLSGQSTIVAVAMRDRTSFLWRSRDDPLISLAF